MWLSGDTVFKCRVTSVSACVISRDVHRFPPSTGGTSVGAFEHQ